MDADIFLDPDVIVMIIICLTYNEDNIEVSITNKIKEELKNNSLQTKILEISKNEWQCTFKKSSESQELVELHVIICDISI